MTDAWESDLLALRDGALRFDAFARTHRTRFERWARALMGTRARLLVALTLEDIVQIMMLTAWRKVDAWDPARRSRKGEPVPLRRYVDWHVGKAVQVAMARELGWSRGGVLTRRAPVRVTDLGALIDRRACVPPVAERAAEAARVARATGGLAGDVIAGVAGGLSLDQVTRRLYSDRARKLRYRFDSLADASAKVEAVCRQTTSALSS